MYDINGQLEMPRSGWIAGSVVVAGGLSAGASYYSGSKSAKAASKAADAQLEQARIMEARLNSAANKIGKYSKAYTKELTKLDKNFDLYDYTAAFESLYESVINPLERDYIENVLPQINAAYSAQTSGGLTSGAYKETLAQSRQGLAETKARLRADERGRAITRNVGEFERKSGVLTQKLQAQIMEPTVRAGQAPTIYQANTDSIAARLAAEQQQANIIPQTVQAGISGVMTGLTGALGVKNANSLSNISKTQSGVSSPGGTSTRPQAPGSTPTTPYRSGLTS